MSAKRGTNKWGTGVQVTAQDLNDTFDSFDRMTAKANSSLSKYDVVKMKPSNSLATGTGNSYNFSSLTNGSLFSLSQHINIGSSAFNQLSTITLSLGIPYDGYTLGYTTYAEIYLADGSKNPTGSAIATSATITKSSQWNFSETYVFGAHTLSANTDYVVIFRGLPKKTGSNNYWVTIYGDTTSTDYFKMSDANNNTFNINHTHQLGNTTYNYVGTGAIVDKSGAQLDWVGIVEANVSAGADASIIVPIGILKGFFTGLTVGSIYYVQSNGTLSTTSTGYAFGVAVSATDMVIIRTKP